ncbi:hypothetical protein M4Z77_17330, partial [Escherichia coli]|nr:hypothetical protein [Escherichia coli]
SILEKTLTRWPVFVDHFKPKMVPVAGWKETQVSDMDFDTIMEKAYEEYFEGLAEGEEALSFSEFKQALSSSAKSNG